MKLTDGQIWYRQRLASDDWDRRKNRILRKRPYVCSIDYCGRYHDLIFHHLSYDRLDTPEEDEDIVLVCGTHNYLCHHEFFRKVPLKRTDLVRRWRYLKGAVWRRFRPSWFFDWIYDTYRI